MIAATARFNMVNAETSVVGIINSDTTWTKANSPYTLVSPLTINNGVTLTIEAGVTINLNVYNIQVNGILSAIGNSEEKILFVSDSSNSGSIAFASDSVSWNEQNSSGCIIENATLLHTLISINGASPKISNNTINAAIISEGAPVISSNIITGDIEVCGSSIVKNNSITGVISAGGSSIITSNIVRGVSYQKSEYGINVMDAYVAENTISGCEVGIYAQGQSVIERNLVSNNSVGILVGERSASIIRNNTIVNNEVGMKIWVNFASLTFIYNNIQDDLNCSIYLIGQHSGMPRDIDAAYNWWGTTNSSKISEQIYDSKNPDYQPPAPWGYEITGVATFTPFLTEPNPQATPDPNATLQTATQGANQAFTNQTILMVSAVLAVLAILAAAVLLLRKRNDAHKHSTPNA